MTAAVPAGTAASAGPDAAPADSAAADHPAAVLAADAPAEVTAAAVARHAAAEPEDGTDSQYSDDKAVGTENIPSDRFCLPYASELA